jgi:hypothetical protein
LAWAKKRPDSLFYRKAIRRSLSSGAASAFRNPQIAALEGEQHLRK